MPRRPTPAEALPLFYDALYDAYGPQHWWPGTTRFEIVVGAILTQNTAWPNVEKALARMKAADCLDWAALRDIDTARLAELIRPSGYYNIKAGRLKNFVGWLWCEHNGDFDRLAAMEPDALRQQLLAVRGIGPETADSIMLYALGIPTFVVDTYTARVAVRHGLIEDGPDYASLKALFEDHLPRDQRRFNEYHALIVAVGKFHCKPRARCAGCPLEGFEHESGEDAE